LYCTYEGKRKSHRCCSSSHTLHLTVMQGRFLASLEMTIWGGDLAKGQRFYMTVVQPLEEGARRRRRIDLPRRGSLLRDGMKANVRSPVFSYRHPKRSRGIFLADWKTVHMRKSVIPSRMEYGVSLSPHIFCLTGVQGRFLASLEMTIRGKRYSHFPPV